MNKAIVIVPTYNERENIERTLSAVFAVTDSIKNWQVDALVVDDTSPDKTYEFVEQLGKRDKRIHLLVNAKKIGLGGAYLKGMTHAFAKLGADVVFEFDADLSHDPRVMPQMLQKIDDGYDLVLGSRYIAGGGIPQNWGLHRKLLSVIGNIVIATVLTDFSIRDWTGGYRVITKKVFNAVESELHSERFFGYTFQIGFLYHAIKKGFKVTEVPFHFVDRTIGVSKLGPEYLRNVLLFIFKVRYQEILSSRIFKFVVVGGVGSVVQLSSLALWRQVLPFQVAFFASIESAIVSNFALNNIWTFADKKIALAALPGKFLQFNLASSGSIIIQQVLAFLGELLIGILPLFVVPLVHISVDTGMMYAVAGIILGMFWNFFAYNRFVWKRAQK